MDRLDFRLLAGEMDPDSFASLASRAEKVRDDLIEGRCAGSDYLGWIRLPRTARADLDAIRECAERLRGEVEDLVVVGIGGSYLGSRALLEAFAEPGRRGGMRIGNGPEIHFAGEHLGGARLAGLLRRLEDRRFAVNVISKSGTTLEPSVAFRLLRGELVARFGAEADRLIVATTDPERGALRGMAEDRGWTSFAIPPDVGGRFSVLSPVGLLPLAVAGLDVGALLEGAGKELERFLSKDSPEENPAMNYAMHRQHFYGKDLAVEVLSTFEPELFLLGDWWAQLFGESEGKEGKGIFPAAARFTTDLHSLGQYLQDGRRQLFETFLRVDQAADALVVPESDDEGDGLGELAGRQIHQLNRAAEEGTIRAHSGSGMPVMAITIPEITPEALGGLVGFFEGACAISALMMGLNPFDQPGVEAYKREMKRLLEVR